MVSVIVPNYNHASFLEQRMESILAQTFQDYELILLDDCSKDDSREIIQNYQQRYPNIRVFFNDQNSGSPFKQWDFGVKQAKGEYVWIAESDDYADRNFLAEMVPILKKYNNIGMAYCDTILVNDRSKPIAVISDYDKRRNTDYVNTGKNEIAQYLCISNTISNVSGVLFRKNSYIDAGFADHTMKYCGDWFLYLRMLLKTDIAYRAKVLNFFRVHSGSSRHEYYVNNLYFEELIRIYNFVSQNISVSPYTKHKIYDQLSRHYCLAFKNMFIPSKQVFRDIKKIIPFFEFYVLKFLAGHVIKKYFS
ncbi:MAG: glycosyltransferase family 2 protein [Desulfobacterales bacterium]|nr:glycosyltransferase family 2 protein [Desulfobacterales bacterium]